MVQRLLHERLCDNLHQKFSILDSCPVGVESGVMEQLGLTKDFLGKQFELRKVSALRQEQRSINYTCLSLPAPIMI